MSAAHPDRALHQLGAGQLGLVTRAQAIACGLSDAQIALRRERGQILRVFAGVYEVTGTPRTAERRAFAACLACGPAAAISHRSAAHLWGLIEQLPRLPEVTVPAARRVRARGVRVYRTRHRRRRDVVRRGVVPLTSPARTLLDLAAVLGAEELELALDEALRRDLTDPAAVLAQLRPRLKGAGALHSLVQDRVGRGVPESVLERRAIALIRRYRLPEPVRQLEVTMRGRRVRLDLAYPEQRVAIELDGRAPHWGRDPWQSDHDRDNVVELSGWRLLRFTWWDVTERPFDVAMKIAEALDLLPVKWRAAAR